MRSVSTGGGATALRPRRSRIARTLRIAFGLLALVFVSWAVVSRWQDVRSELAQVHAGIVLLAGGIVIVSLAASMLAWRSLLADLGSPLALRSAVQVLFLGQLGKYIPAGTVWAVMAQTELARDLGVPRRRSTAAGFVFNGLSLGVALLLGALSLPALTGGNVPSWAVWAVALSPMGLVCLGPGVVTRLVNLALRLLRKQPLEHPFSWRGMLTAVGWTGASWLLMGGQIYVLGVDLGADPAAFMLPALGGFAVAWACGFLSMVAPSGAGVREILLTATLAPHLPGGAAAALTIAVISRLVMTLADLMAAATGFGLGRRQRGTAHR